MNIKCKSIKFISATQKPRQGERLSCRCLIKLSPQEPGCWVLGKNPGGVQAEGDSVLLRWKESMATGIIMVSLIAELKCLYIRHLHKTREIY